MTRQSNKKVSRHVYGQQIARVYFRSLNLQRLPILYHTTDIDTCGRSPVALTAKPLVFPPLVPPTSASSTSTGSSPETPNFHLIRLTPSKSGNIVTSTRASWTTNLLNSRNAFPHCIQYGRTRSSSSGFAFVEIVMPRANTIQVSIRQFTNEIGERR